MTTHMLTPTTPTWIRPVLRANTLVCVALGADALIFNTALANWMGMPAMLLLILGLGLVGYGLFFWWWVGTPTVAIVRAVTLLDVAWIVASMAVIFFPILPLTDIGKIILDIVALITAGFAITQYIALRRMQGQ